MMALQQIKHLKQFSGAPVKDIISSLIVIEREKNWSERLWKLHADYYRAVERDQYTEDLEIEDLVMPVQFRTGLRCLTCN